TLTSLSHCRRPQRHRPTTDPLRRSPKPTQAPSRRSTPPPSPPSHRSPNADKPGFLWISWVSSSIQALGFSGFHRQSRRCLPQPIALVFRRTQESKSLKDIPVVIMSSKNIPSRINRCLDEGAEEFFLKPVQLSDVNKLKPHLLKGRDKESEPSINKRKGMEECHSHDKTRTKYDGLEVV
ncbi:two-component response regulator ORR9-like, partial [Castanea sativa]|uniref:two-component response regulator ORR9-like n=1 Tax=Castanea sativa TaxID=21020 RepID=UPI003F64CFDD